MDGAAFLSLHSWGVSKPEISTSGCVQGWSLEWVWGKFGENLYPSTLCWVPDGRMLGLPAPLSPAKAVDESLELPTGKHPPWNAFICLHPRQGAGRTDFLMSVERLKCGMWTPSKIFTRQQRVSRVVGSLHGHGQVRSLSCTAPTV